MGISTAALLLGGLGMLGLPGLCSGLVELIDGGGKMASASEISSLLSGLSGKSMSVVAVVGSRGSGKSTLLNEAFGGDFPARSGLGQGDTTGVCAAVSEGMLLLDCDGMEGAADPRTSTISGEAPTSASQATAFSSALSDVVLVNIWRSDLGRSVASNVRTLKAVLGEKLRTLEGVPKSPMALLVAVHDCDPGADGEALEAAVMEEVRVAWEEAEGLQRVSGEKLEDYFSVEALALPHPKYHASAYASAASGLREKLLAAGAAAGAAAAEDAEQGEGEEVMGGGVREMGPPPGFRERLSTTWTSVRAAGAASLIPAKSELVAVYKVDTTFGEVMARADAQLKAWRQTIGNGNVVPKFGERASKLFTSSLKGFDSKTIRFSTSSTRSSKRASLVAVLESGIKVLFQRQLSMLSVEAQRAYKKALVKLLDGDKLSEESEAVLLRKTLFAFEADAVDITPEALKLGFEEEYEELEADLQEFSEKFTESPAAQLKAMQKVKKKVDKPRGRRGMGVGLGLVGMVRPSGYGNLQGYGGYRMGPHTITMGYSNDADLPDSLIDGEKPPLFRFQPKLNLDIDL